MWFFYEIDEVCGKDLRIVASSAPSELNLETLMEEISHTWNQDTGSRAQVRIDYESFHIGQNSGTF